MPIILKAQTIKARCSTCKTSTVHKLVYFDTDEKGDPQNFYQCQKCKTVVITK